MRRERTYKKEVEITEVQILCDMCETEELTSRNTYRVCIRGPECGVGDVEFYGVYERALEICPTCFCKFITKNCRAAR